MISNPVRHRRLAVALAAAVLALAALLVPPVPAAAHTGLVGSSPAEGETVVALERVSLEFTEQLLEIGHELVLVAPDGTRTALAVDGAVTAVIEAAVPAGALLPGVNVLVWRVVASDGHPIEGEISFTYAPVAAPSPAPASPSPAPTAPSPTASPSPTGGATAASAVGDGRWGWVVGLAGAGAVAAAVTLAVRRRVRH